MSQQKRHAFALTGMLCAASMICCGLAAGTATTALADGSATSTVTTTDPVQTDPAQTDGVQSVTATHDPETTSHAFDAPAVASADVPETLAETRSSTRSADASTQTLSASAELPGADGLSSVAVTWRQTDADAEAAQPVVKLRYRDDDGTWSDWTQVETQIGDGNGVTARSGSSASATQAATADVQGTDPVYVGKATDVEAQVTLPDGSDATDVNLVTIDSGYAADDVDAVSDGSDTTSGTTSGETDGNGQTDGSGSGSSSNGSSNGGSGESNGNGSGNGSSGTDGSDSNTGTDSEPDEGKLDINIPIYRREQWWRKGLPAPSWPADDSGHWRGAVIHHTVDRNDYSQAEAKVIVQNIYTFHAKTRGWGDIGYNLLVDRFGGVWEGREEGVAHKVVLGSNAIGAHTGSFNEATFGVAVIGSFHENDKPTEASVRAVASVIAKEFKAMNIMTAHDTFVWHGTQNRISGHGDSAHWYDKRNRTLCPGKHLRARINDIRDMVGQLLDESMPANSTPVYRLYNRWNGLHHYTADSNEREVLISKGWNDEGIVFYAAKSGEPVYRLYNPYDHNHLYTLSTKERDQLTKRGWKTEGTAWSTAANGDKPVYRLYNRSNHEHLYTTSAKEYQTLGKKGWQQENVAWNGL
ncbi:N-acetylmuramoyl-L-alanine amidase [Bifidobacterium amazonense]|uniref:N-acetylmuramoyl-L-alanine amidase n=1 Tax=Bifidobacterium amazonense TaxID=2809027 RepID=A0ABS9VX14_9BIFI|nr:N-acetylmuramoyl-L-alanine amidase [Bifidobacterium amazonense]MCH9276646.1 N-acetylmuramoyl-L-alanine amidase [Bifidobacterium amazonense]